MRSPSLAAVALILAASAVACGSRTSTTTAPVSTGVSPLDQWTKAYTFLAAQTKPTEIECGWFVNVAGSLSPAPQAPVGAFYDFSDTTAWMSHTVTRDNIPSGTFEMCGATVPTTVPYGPAIESFLAGHGLVFGTTAPGLTPIEIAYAGQNASDPDIIYRDKPGLFGLRLALGGLGTKPFVPGTSKIIQPKDAATATEYLQYAQPLLTWYGYKG